MNLRGIDFQGLAILAGVGLVGVVLWRASVAARQAAGAAGQAAAAAVPYVNPADGRNVVNAGVTAVGAAVSGDDSWTLGGWLAEMFSPEVQAANDMNRQRLPGWGGTVDRVRGGW